MTDTAVGEAAHCLLHGIDRGLVSIEPADFTGDPMSVEQVLEDGKRISVDVRNYWEPEAVEACFAVAPTALVPWTALGDLAVSRFERLRFAENTFEPLRASRKPYWLASRSPAYVVYVGPEITKR